mmetsp:Transcript_26291/g.63357  ORF Transcript_26291/g.63357 Transcript_26291/m.63357 type:complete len:250 (+) Transcript_26291:1195-1944(+)
MCETPLMNFKYAMSIRKSRVPSYEESSSPANAQPHSQIELWAHLSTSLFVVARMGRICSWEYHVYPTTETLRRRSNFLWPSIRAHPTKLHSSPRNSVKTATAASVTMPEKVSYSTIDGISVWATSQVSSSVFSGPPASPPPFPADFPRFFFLFRARPSWSLLPAAAFPDALDVPVPGVAVGMWYRSPISSLCARVGFTRPRRARKPTTIQNSGFSTTVARVAMVRVGLVAAGEVWEGEGDYARGGGGGG